MVKPVGMDMKQVHHGVPVEGVMLIGGGPAPQVWSYPRGADRVLGQVFGSEPRTK